MLRQLCGSRRCMSWCYPAEVEVRKECEDDSDAGGRLNQTPSHKLIVWSALRIIRTPCCGEDDEAEHPLQPLNITVLHSTHYTQPSQRSFARASSSGLRPSTIASSFSSIFLSSSFFLEFSFNKLSLILTSSSLCSSIFCLSCFSCSILSGIICCSDSPV